MQAGASSLKKWYFWATHSQIEPIIAAARTVKRHWDGILRWFDSKIANGLIEGLNSLVQAAKAKARGYRSTRNLKAIIYLLAGKLDMQLPALDRFYPRQTANTLFCVLALMLVGAHNCAVDHRIFVVGV